VAPVSTINCTGLPLISPLATKWPPGPAAMAISRPFAPLLPPPTRDGAPPIATVSLRPPISTSACPGITRRSVTPFAVAPTDNVCGAPSIISKALLSPMLPASDTLWAPAPPAHRPSITAASSLRIGISRGSS
jgi:hypothetical protein